MEELLKMAYGGWLTLRDICNLVEEGTISEQDAEWLASIVLDC